ncbi:uncharacterized protein PHACADRAFT_260094 [Phanerochaete carnosa HHB-10118-sp]|uniref:Uncharacterized protein n=1 Tax=Phanerochaete carnosa (strain HHB-10118-sp) TaxID=650164 RepID=K5W3B9_PHACS|nr:uncharacterized protein PHACADRAFT_260094 [Phanerochaete carnosa HHB-10118-sp]EKM53635.1 hypothetical protein PHACADRAFT_260094 [Phanerochaete carnosa HHB-10118-sp]
MQTGIPLRRRGEHFGQRSSGVSIGTPTLVADQVSRGLDAQVLTGVAAYPGLMHAAAYAKIIYLATMYSIIYSRRISSRFMRAVQRSR